MRRLVILGSTLLVASMAAGIGWLNWQSAPPAGFQEDLDESRREFEGRRWERPPLGSAENEQAGNAFVGLREVVRTADYHPGERRFGPDGSVTRQLRRGRLTESARTRLAGETIQRHIRALRRQTRSDWSWAGHELSLYLQERQDEGMRGTGYWLRTARLIAADALRRGGGACLREAADLVRMFQDRAAGAPLIQMMTKSAAFGNLRYIVPVCAAHASSEELAGAEQRFRRLVTHPAPIARTLEAALIFRAMKISGRLSRARPLPTSRSAFRDLRQAGGLYRVAQLGLEGRDALPEVSAAGYPEAIESLQLDVPEGAFLKRQLRRDQTAQNTLRAALITVAYYESTEAPSDEPPAVHGEAVVTDAVSGESMEWRSTEEEGVELCVRRLEAGYQEQKEAGHLCWGLEPRSTESNGKEAKPVKEEEE